jgi:hypothetical protein
MPQYTLTLTEQPKGHSDHGRHRVRQDLAYERAVSLGLTNINVGTWSGGNPNTRTWTLTDTVSTTPYGDADNRVTRLVNIFNYFKFITVSTVTWV